MMEKKIIMKIPSFSLLFITIVSINVIADENIEKAVELMYLKKYYY